MTGFHLPHMPAPYQPPEAIRRVVDRCRPEHWLQKDTRHPVPSHDDTDAAGIDWSGISSNVIATVLGGLLLSLAGGIVFLAWTVPRQQEMILSNQERTRLQFTDLSEELKRLKENDRLQDDRLTKIEAGR